MIVLSDSTYILGNVLPPLGVIICSLVIVIYLLGFEAAFHLNEIKTWFVLLILGLLLGVCVYFTDMAKEYKIYLQDMTLEELETEYEIHDIDGLILECTKKGEMK